MSAGKPQSKYSCTGKLQKKTVAFDGYSVIYFGCNTQPYALTSISVAILYVCWFLICRMASDEDVRNVCCISSVRCLKSVFVKYFFLKFAFYVANWGGVEPLWVFLRILPWHLMFFLFVQSFGQCENILLVQDGPIRLFYRWRREEKHINPRCHC